MSIEGIITTTPILSVFILLLLMIIMMYLYIKMRIFLIILVVYSFSLVIGVSSFTLNTIPFTPYFQLFFLLFQSIIFTITSIKVYTYDK